MEFIYLDAAATTPSHIDVIEEINRVQLDYWGNPSSIHKFGIRAREILERSRYSIASLLNSCSEEIFFTSGASESNNIAIGSICNSLDKGRIVISSVEHPSIINAVSRLKDSGWDVVCWPVDNNGVIKLELVNEMLAQPTKFVSLIWGQSEIGTIQPINLIGKYCKDRNIPFHIDATQVLPNGLFDWQKIHVDILSCSSHKLQGPKGVGMLMIKNDIRERFKSLRLDNIKESSIRSGTQPVQLIAGFAAALKLIKKRIRVDQNNTYFSEDDVTLFIKKLKNRFNSNEQLTLTGHEKKRIPNHISYFCHTKAKQPILGRDVVRELSKRDIYISSGSACSSSRSGPNSILTAINLDEKHRESGIRISAGPWVENYDIDKIYHIFNDCLLELENKLDI